MKTNSGLAEDRLNEIYSGIASNPRNLPTQVPDLVDSDVETDGFRISRHIVGIDNRYWDQNRYQTIQHKKELMPNEKYTDIDGKNFIKNTRKTMPKQRPRPFQVHDNERYFNHVFSLKPQRSLKNIYSNEYYQPNSIDRAEI